MARSLDVFQMIARSMHAVWKFLCVWGVRLRFFFWGGVSYFLVELLLLHGVLVRLGAS